MRQISGSGMLLMNMEFNDTSEELHREHRVSNPEDELLANGPTAQPDTEELKVDSLGERSATLHIHTDAQLDMVELLVVSREELEPSVLVMNELLSNISVEPEILITRRMYITAVFTIQEGYDASFVIGEDDMHSSCGFTFRNAPLQTYTTYYTTVIYVRRPAMERFYADEHNAEHTVAEHIDIATKPGAAKKRGCMKPGDFIFRNSRSFRTRFRYHTMIYAVLMISMLIATMCLAIFLIRVMCDIMAGGLRSRSSKPKAKQVAPVKETNFKHDNMKLVFTSNRINKDDKDQLMSNMLV